VTLVIDQHVIGALLPDAAHEPLRVAVRPRRPRRYLDHLHAFVGEHRVERERELRVRRAAQPQHRLRPAGHSQIAVTMNIYGHVMPAMQQEAAGQIDAALGEPEDQTAEGQADTEVRDELAGDDD
jgi:hypothetical protein